VAAERGGAIVDFKGVHFPKEAILYVVFFYLRYPGFYRDLEEIMEERGVDVDHGTLNRWVVKFAPLMAAQAQSRKKPAAESWRIDETYIKVKGKWTYYYRVVDNTGQTLDFMLSERRNKAAARRFFKRAIGTNGLPDGVVIDKSGANLAGLQSVNVILTFTGSVISTKIPQVKYLDNIIEQDHRFVKPIKGPILSFKAFHSAEATLAGIEATHMIRKGSSMPAALLHLSSLRRSQHNYVRDMPALKFQQNLRQNPQHIHWYFRSGEELEDTLDRYVRFYNQQVPQPALGCNPTLQTLKEW
jgi:putative transposase